MNRTKIEWVKNPDGSQGYTWNPITGCLNGCEYCYARKLANGRLRSRYSNNLNVACDKYDIKEFEKAVNDPFYPRFWEGRLRELAFHIGNRSLKGIFVCDMSDLFGIGIPKDWTDRVLSAIRMNPQHRFYLLTKQPQNLIKFSPFPSNCWVGVTATDTRMALEACLYLGDIEATVRFLSIEPMLNSINLPAEHLKVCKIGQVIIGAQTKPYKPPKIEWVEEIVRACDKAGVPVFLKDNLVPLLNKKAWENTRLWGNSTGKPRQEMPDGTS